MRTPARSFTEFGHGSGCSFRAVGAEGAATLCSDNIDFEKERWTAADIDALGDLLCRFEHRFPQHSTDLGHITADVFRTILEGRRETRQTATVPTLHGTSSKRPNWDR